VSGAVAAGFYGKLPARGDFVRVGLPRDFVDPWDQWQQSVIAASRELIGADAWLELYLESPVWRFVLPPHMCGELAVLGVMLPSVDKAGRYFPLTFAALHPRGIAAAAGEPWLDRCEAAGRAALEQDTPPQEIAAMIGTPDLPGEAAGTLDAIWWSEGSERVPPNRMTMRGLPDPATYAAMLGAENQRTEAGEDTWESTL
jgi:type VI secretion system protein ImpM